MSSVTGKQYGVGARHARIFALNSSGSPAATNTTPYSGVQVVGAKAFTLNIPDPRKISHQGDDRVLQVDYLPAVEAISAELTTSQEDQTAYALLTGTSKVTVGESTLVGLGTSQQGFEPQVGLLLYQQSLDETGTRNWRYVLIPKATVYPHPGGMNENPSEHRFIVSPAVVSKHLWETAFSSGVEGFTEAQALVGAARYKPLMDSWVAATATTTFTLSTTAADTAKMAVWVEGAAQTAGDVTKGTTQVQFVTAPGNNKRVMCFYEVP